MAKLLNLAMAAKMAGVSRKDVQTQIREGKLHTFEGMIRVNELIRVYPGAELTNKHEMLDFVARVKLDAVNKINEHSEERLLQQMVELKNCLGREQQKNMAFAQVIVGLKDRLVAMNAKCEKKDKAMLETMMTWLNSEMEQNAIK
ncbi:MAG: hypothetical protein HOM11_02850 [Methylococcales bacterium]|jgi:CDP-4-dehydro-6-deoxyglucose reductase, E3|nr:hypothetical protein [Methylococcales bacterium]MBT7442826.1 hypothetical protein [Methylococcales bacterium]